MLTTTDIHTARGLVAINLSEKNEVELRIIAETAKQLAESFVTTYRTLSVEELRRLSDVPSARDLLRFSWRALQRANDLAANMPSTRLAIEAGIEDRSYNTVGNGRVNRYRGEAIITLSSDRKFRAIGMGPIGDPWSIFRNGYIKYEAVP